MVRLGRTLKENEIEQSKKAMRVLEVNLENMEKYRNRVMNIHPSLLPAFPGTIHAQREALEYGVKISGCTVHFTDEGVDTGPIIIRQQSP